MATVGCFIYYPLSIYPFRTISDPGIHASVDDGQLAAEERHRILSTSTTASGSSPHTPPTSTRSPPGRG
jgi:hypothetical protein